MDARDGAARATTRASNRLPGLDPASPLPPPLKLPLTARDISAFLKRYVPYLNGSRDVAEPESLCLWDAAAKAGLSYRTHGESRLDALERGVWTR